MRLTPHYVLESQDEFLALFPHRFDYIWSEHPTVGQTPAWQTERRHPLGDRLIHQGSYLYGVRFGADTQYCLLDIDIGSPYHPQHDPFAISRIMAALEPLGLVSYFACTSSYSDGLHLYLPFSQPQSSWKLAIALACLLENAGFKPSPGQLEVFPNPKPYIGEGASSLFNAHRLPLQTGSYLLNQTFQPVWSDQTCFVQQWRFAQSRNDLDGTKLKRLVHQARRRHFQISGKADKFINDLNAEIELGWTGHGQTNRLLGRITMRAYVFHHMVSGGVPLVGPALVQEVVAVAQSLPGYHCYCRHQHEIEHRAAEWAVCIENSHYFPYGNPQGKFKARQPELEAAIEKAPTWNQQQSESTRDRIRNAIADLLNQDALPAKATARFHSLLKYGIGGASLYRHRDLWHPHHLTRESETLIDSQPENSHSHSLRTDIQSLRDTQSFEESFEEAFEEERDSNSIERELLDITSLLPLLGSNVFPNQGCAVQVVQFHPVPASNFSEQPGLKGLGRVVEAEKLRDRLQSNDLMSQRTQIPIQASYQEQISPEMPDFRWVVQVQHWLMLIVPIWLMKVPKDSKLQVFEWPLGYWFPP